MKEQERVFVTGASGFTGGHLCRILKNKGFMVKAMVRPTSKVEHLKAMGVEMVAADLTDSKTLSGILKDSGIVVHAAAAYRKEGIGLEVFWKVNVDGTRALLEEAQASNVKRFIHCSTVGVQGEISHAPAKESDPYNPGDHYQVSKMEGEQLALSFCQKAGLPVVVVRPVGIYGPGDTRFLKLFRHIYNGSFRMIGKGNVLYHMTFVDDLVEGIFLALKKPRAIGQVYTIAGGEYVTINELVSIIARVLNKPVPSRRLPLWPVYAAAVVCENICRPLRIEPPIFRRRLDFFTKDRAFDISKAQKDLDYKPTVSLQEGLNITARWYKDRGWL